jgi:hypothetical protein
VAPHQVRPDVTYGRAIIFLCDTQDFHAIDWFHEVKDILRRADVFVATTNAAPKPEHNLLRDDDRVVELRNIHRFLTRKRSRFGDLWRNVVQAGSAPLQALSLRKVVRRHPNALVHAHSMYYALLCWLGRIDYVVTPQGSDILMRPDSSRVYRSFATRLLRAARAITVDSTALQDKILRLAAKPSFLFQNGIDTRAIAAVRNAHPLDRRPVRESVVSIRGFYPNYQIHRLLDARDRMAEPVAITFIYPFSDEPYRNALAGQFRPHDVDLGCLLKHELYARLAAARLVVSIPESDSSPRSVYEAIFCGCGVAVTDSPWVGELPACMRARVIVVDLENPRWLPDALRAAAVVTATAYVPSADAILAYDQHESMKRVCREIYAAYEPRHTGHDRVRVARRQPTS